MLLLHVDRYVDDTVNESQSMVQTSDLYKKSGGNEPPPTQSKQWRQRLAKYLPIALLLAFLLLLTLLFGDRFVPAQAVQLETVVTLRSQQQSTETPADGQDTEQGFGGTTLFQASGWIEASPQPIRVVALNDGFVDTVHVLEGERVTKGQRLVTLVDDDARLDLDSAQAAHSQRSAAITERQAMVRATQAALLRLTEEVEIEHARLEELRDDETRLNKVSSNSVSEKEIQQSRLRVFTQQASIQALEATRGELEAELAARNAAVLRARHELEAAKTDLARKQLALDRMEIRSPIDGIIQRLFVSPGVKRFAMMDDPESATVATLFKPDSLQARIDVPLEEAAQLRLGQSVRLRSVYLQDAIFEGRVSRIEGQADLQRNTLQVKVDLLSPADGLRPEMLCRAEFLASRSGNASSSSPSSGRAAVYVPIDAIIERSNEHFVWLLDASGKHVTQQAVRLDTDERDGYRRTLEGLKPGDRVVIHPATDLKQGDRIRLQDTSH